MADTPDDDGGRTPRGSLWLHVLVLVLGLVIASTAFGEGATQPLAALGYADYSLTMLLGGPAVDRWGRVAVLRSWRCCSSRCSPRWS